MTEWKPKRFWKTAAPLGAAGGAYSISLDGRPVKTPAKAPLVVPSRALAEALAEEWNAVEDEIRPQAMPLTRAANAAIDKVVPQRDAVVTHLAEYGATDLLCYRAEGPEDLVRRQAEGWDPLLDWAAERFGARLATTRGVVHLAQPADSLARLRAQVQALGPFPLTALSELVTLSGSLVIGLAAVHGAAAGEALWRLSRIDEDWQAELWGVDPEAAALAEDKRRAFHQAIKFFSLSET
jgi:chaperone required for assembly of F1-ATPase